MRSPGNSLYLPYGAYELKSRYQRNLLFSNLLLGGLIGITLLSFLIFTPARDVILVPPQVEETDTTTIRVNWEVPPSIIYDQHQLPLASQQERQGIIPVPVSDDTPFLDTVTIMTRAELAAVVGIPDAQPRDDGIYVAPDNTDYIPSPTEYVITERLPEFVYKATPIYPRLLEAAGITGVVAVQVLVNKEGNVQEARIARSSGTAGLDEAALEAAYKNKFTPAIRNGLPIFIWVSYTVQFVQE